MGRESIEAKALRYIAEGRVKVQDVGVDAVVAVQGSRSEPYLVRWSGVGWACPCEARVMQCAHVIAALLVVDPPEAGEEASVSLEDYLA